MDNNDWINELAPFDRWNERVAMAMFALFDFPKSYFDIGSGTGAMVNIARKIGIESYGIDQLVRDRDYLINHDLCKPYSMNLKFDLVTSIETAEHIPPEYDSILCDTIADHVITGGTLIFTAAHPGQGGSGHVNMRPGTYWRDMFYQRGLQYRTDKTYKLMLAWKAIDTPQYWLMSNVQVFTRS